MNSTTCTPVREKLSALYAQIDELRKDDRISKRGERIFSERIDANCYAEVLADGLGGAHAVFARGQFGQDEITLLAQRGFASESEASRIFGLFLDGKYGDGPVLSIREVFDASWHPEMSERP